jgi:peptidoglycan-associated lipoprotein
MTKQLLVAAMSTALIFLSACGSKDKKADDAAAGAGSDTNIATKPLSFDPMGSDSGNISGLRTINFEYDKASLTTEARKILSENANWIRDNQDVSIQIEGHCDERGSVEYNLALGERRAKSVKTYLTNLGIDTNRMNVISYGKEKPIAQGDSEDAWSKNRRANFVPLPK